jgi:hypothetical protein
MADVRTYFLLNFWRPGFFSHVVETGMYEEMFPVAGWTGGIYLGVGEYEKLREEAMPFYYSESPTILLRGDRKTRHNFVSMIARSADWADTFPEGTRRRLTMILLTAHPEAYRDLEDLPTGGNGDIPFITSDIHDVMKAAVQVSGRREELLILTDEVTLLDNVHDDPDIAILHEAIKEKGHGLHVIAATDWQSDIGNISHLLEGAWSLYGTFGRQPEQAGDAQALSAIHEEAYTRLVSLAPQKFAYVGADGQMHECFMPRWDFNYTHK